MRIVSKPKKESFHREIKIFMNAQDQTKNIKVFKGIISKYPDWKIYFPIDIGYCVMDLHEGGNGFKYIDYENNHSR
jgi:hypothetical protein